MSHLSRIGIGVAFALLPLVAAGTFAQGAQVPKPTIERVPAPRIDSLEGKDLYRSYCAVCHGVEGRGNGPAALAMKTQPPDLTTIAKRHGKFPRQLIERAILGDDQPAPPAHGSREMPVWGPVFRQAGGGKDVATLATSNLIGYLQSIQEK